ncbi:MAG: hypothetical protein R2828_34105 [Saprospiraceae bacterium]
MAKTFIASKSWLRRLAGPLCIIKEQKMKEYQIEEGQGILNIICDGFVSTIQLYERSITATWPDCSGSIGRYIASSNFQNKELIANNLNHSLNNSDKEGSESLIPEFLKLFTNGNYQVTFHNEIKEFDLQYVGKYEEYKNFTYNYYPSVDRNFLFSQDAESLDRDRIDRYKLLIEKGERPIAIIYSHLYLLEKEFEWKFLYNDNVWSDEFIIDGHHKMVAYDELRISPNYFHIRKILKSSNLDFNSFKSVNGLLNTSEIEHFILNSLEIRTDKSPESNRYNEIIDNYLKTTERVDFQLLTKMAKNINSEDSKLKNWANSRFESLKERIDTGTKVLVPELLISKFEGHCRLPLN